MIYRRIHFFTFHFSLFTFSPFRLFALNIHLYLSSNYENKKNKKFFLRNCLSMDFFLYLCIINNNIFK